MGVVPNPLVLKVCVCVCALGQCELTCFDKKERKQLHCRARDVINLLALRNRKAAVMLFVTEYTERIDSDHPFVQEWKYWL